MSPVRLLERGVGAVKDHVVRGNVLRTQVENKRYPAEGPGALQNIPFGSSGRARDRGLPHPTGLPEIPDLPIPGGLPELGLGLPGVPLRTAFPETGLMETSTRPDPRVVRSDLPVPAEADRRINSAREKAVVGKGDNGGRGLIRNESPENLAPNPVDPIFRVGGHPEQLPGVRGLACRDGEGSAGDKLPGEKDAIMDGGVARADIVVRVVERR